MLFNENAVKNQIQHYKNIVWSFIESLSTTRGDKARNDKNLDQANKESFPASDSPAHFSKSSEDRSAHV